MGGTRALFASIGVSVSLVAAAALSLFAVSVVIAFGGWSAGMNGSSAPRALLVDDGVANEAREARARVAAAKPVVLRAPQRARPQPAAAAARARSARPQRARADVRTPAVSRRPVPVAAPAPPAAVPPAPKPHAGDAVRRVGDGLSTGVRDTGDALGDATAPLSPPVGAAVEKVVDRVADVLERTTGRTGATLGRLER